MVLPVCHETKWTVLNGTPNTRKTDGANPRIPEGLEIVYLCVEMPAGSGPVLVGVHVVVQGKPVEIETAWVRGGHEGSLRWRGEFPIPKETTFFFAAQNDTGASLVMSAHWVTRRVPT